MALDFPTSPTNGQVYGNFIYSTAKGAWQAKPITGKVTTSATAPSAPSNGDEWFNTNDGNLYVYYTDVDGSQWVQVKSDATLSSTLGNRVTTLETFSIGMMPVIPSSVVVGSGTASVSATGLVTFSGVSSLSFNNIFSSTFTNYKVVFSNVSCAAGNAEIRLNLRASGTNATTEYYGAGYVAFLGNTLGFSQIRSGNYIPGATVDAGDYGTSTFDFQRPYLALRTGINSRGAGYYSSNPLGMQMDGFHNFPNSYDGATFYPGSGTISGTAQIYGIR